MHIPRGNLESRIGGIVPDLSTPIVDQLPVGRALGLRRALARGARLRGRRLAGRRLRRLEAERLPLERAARAQRGAARPLLPSHADPRGRRGRAAEAARLDGAAGGRRRPRLAGRPVPGRGGRRHDRDRRRRRRRRVQPAAPGAALDGLDRHGQDGVGQAAHRGAQSRRARRHLPRAPDVGEHRPAARGRRRDRRRHRQLPHALPAQRREPAPPHPGRARLDLPLRRTADGLPAVRGPVLSLPLPAAAAARARAVVRRGRRARRPAGHHGLAAGERGAQAAARHRRAADRPADPVRRARHELPRGAAAPRPRLPRVRRRRRPDRVHRLRGVLPAPARATT